MAGIRRLAIFNALLDFVDDDGYQLTEAIDDSIFLLMSVSNKNKERQPAVRIIGYVEQVVPSYTDSVFRSHFRLSRQSAETVSLPWNTNSAQERKTTSQCRKTITFNSLGAG